MKQQNIIQAYRRYAPVYDSLFGMVLEPGRRHLCKAVHSIAPQSLLEVGVGTGLTLFRYPDSVDIVGVDVSAEMLSRALRRAEEMPQKKIALHNMDAENMDFPDHAFDCVTLPYVLSVTTSPHRLIEEARRVCKPGGKIIVLNHFSGSSFWWLLERCVSPIAEKIGFHASFSFEDHILSHDWQVESVRAVNLFGLSRLVVIRNG